MVVVSHGSNITTRCAVEAEGTGLAGAPASEDITRSSSHLLQTPRDGPLSWKLMSAESPRLGHITQLCTKAQECPSIWKQIGRSHLRSAEGKTALPNKAKPHSGQVVIQGAHRHTSFPVLFFSSDFQGIDISLPSYVNYPRR